MFDQRLQILVTLDQRRRLEAEARRTGSSVGALVREAIDLRWGGGTARQERIAAAERIATMSAAPLSVEEMHEILDSRHDPAVPVEPPV